MNEPETIRRLGVSRRERQLVEIFLLSADGEDGRAAVLAAEHICEFPLDADVLAQVEHRFRSP